MRASAPPRLRLHGWRHPAVVAVALLGVAAGFAQYAVTASLSDVAAAFGANGGADTITEQAGLSVTTVGLGLAVIRCASLAALPVSSVADRVGRRRVLLWCTAAGLTLTALAAISPSFWWFVAIVAVGRPLLSAATAVGAVVAGEETTSEHRTKAVALAIAGYGIGVGLVSVVRVPVSSVLSAGFRGLFALALVALLALPLIARLLEEPDRFVRLRADAQRLVRRRVLAAVHPNLRGRLLVLTGVSFAINFVTGPANTFLFFYAEGNLGVTRAAMAGATITAGALGLLGLLVGRWAADRLGRRTACLLTHVLLTAAGVLLYSGTPVALFAGYWLGVLIQGAYGPAFGAISTEVFPTSNRATAQGWLTAAGVLGAVAGLVLFGAVSDATDSYVVGALAVCLPCALAAAGYLALPETRGQELEQSAPEVGVTRQPRTTR